MMMRIDSLNAIDAVKRDIFQKIASKNVNKWNAFTVLGSITIMIVMIEDVSVVIKSAIFPSNVRPVGQNAENVKKRATMKKIVEL